MRSIWGFEQALVCQPQGTVAPFFKRAGFHVYEIGMFQDYDLWAAWRLASLARRDNWPIVHAHHSAAHAVALVARHFASFGLVVSRRVTHRIPWYPTSKWKYCSSKIDRYICVSHAVRQVLEKAGVPAAKLAVIGSSTDFTRFCHRLPSLRILDELGLPPSAGKAVFGVIANYSSWKGQDVFLEAFSKINADGCVAVLAGRDTDSDLLRRKAGPRLKLLGWRADVEEILSVLSALVCPSLKGEGSSGAIREAFAANQELVDPNRPAPQPHSGGLGRLESQRDATSFGDGVGARDPSRGWLFKSGDSASLCRCLEEFLGENRQAIKAKTARAHQFVRQHFGVDNMVRKTAQVYKEVAG
ncbi:MAG: glycosyltransferase [Elusimicrobia bacterium]|nr:glycosyltransferase [Elusimicrobiota bacterium]